MHEGRRQYSRVTPTGQYNLTAWKLGLLLAIITSFIVTTKCDASRLTTFVWYTSGLVLIVLLCDIVGHYTVGWLTECILRRLLQAAHYFLRLLFYDLWKSRPKKKWWHHNILYNHVYKTLLWNLQHIASVMTKYVIYCGWSDFLDQELLQFFLESCQRSLV